MRLNCHFIDDYLHARREAREKWHRWFAWYPVTVAHGDCRWLEVVERRFQPDFFVLRDDEKPPIFLEMGELIEHRPVQGRGEEM